MSQVWLEGEQGGLGAARISQHLTIHTNRLAKLPIRLMAARHVITRLRDYFKYACPPAPITACLPASEPAAMWPRAQQPPDATSPPLPCFLRADTIAAGPRALRTACMPASDPAAM